MTVTGRVRLISISERTLVIGDGSIIPLDGIAAITEKQKKSEFQADSQNYSDNIGRLTDSECVSDTRRKSCKTPCRSEFYKKS